MVYSCVSWAVIAVTCESGSNFRSSSIISLMVMVLGRDAFEYGGPAASADALVGAVAGSDGDATEDVFALAPTAFDDCSDPLYVVHYVIFFHGVGLWLTNRVKVPRFKGSMAKTKIAKETWLAVKTCYLAGMSTNDIADKFEIDRGTVSVKAWKAGWSKVRKLPENIPTDKSMVEKVADMLESDWKSKGSAHRRLVFDKANSALREANIPAPRTWKDAQIADSMARKAAGLEDSENTKSTIVNVGWLQQTAGGAVTKIDIESDIVDAEVVEETAILSD